MDTDIKNFLAGKPVCFALPLKFHLVDPRCENCRVVNECGCAVRGMVDAISQGQVGNKAIRDARLSKYKSHLTYWDDADKHPVRRYPVPLLDALVQRAEDYRDDAVLQTMRSLDMVSSDQEYDREFDDPLGDVSSIAPESKHDEGREQAGTAEYRSDARLGMGDEVAGASISGNRTDGTSASAVCTLPPALVPPTGASVPLPPDLLSSVSHEELQQELRLLIQDYYAAGPTSYTGLRAHFLDINFALNLARRWGPRFRDIPVSFTPAGAEFNQLDVDRQVLDLHWLWSTNRRKPCTLRQYERLLCSDPFDLACAERFAGEKWRWETKAEYLHLSPDVQWELCAIQSKAISKRWDAIKDGDRVGAHVRQTGARQVEAVLQALTAPQHERHIPDRVATWMAVTICKKQWAKAAKLCALITGGKARDPRQIQRTFETVDKAIKNAKSGKP